MALLLVLVVVATSTPSSRCWYEFQRVMVLNGINVPALRPDLLDRCLLIRLSRIPPENRRPESELWHEFEGVRPRIVGAMFDALSAAIRTEPSVELDVLPRTPIR